MEKMEKLKNLTQDINKKYKQVFTEDVITTLYNNTSAYVNHELEVESIVRSYENKRHGFNFGLFGFFLAIYILSLFGIF